MDRLLRAQIAAAVRDAVREALEGSEEVWLSGDQLCEQFGMFSKGWLKAYGYKLPRTQAVVTDEGGEEHRSGWAYPKNKIQRMIRDGSIMEL